MAQQGGGVYAVALGANFLGDFLGEIGVLLFAKLADVNLDGRIDFLALLLLVLAAWFKISPHVIKISNYLNPHARYWNSVVSKFVFSVSFLLAYLVKTYIISLVRSAQNIAEFSVPTLLVIVFVALLSIFALLIYFEEIHGITVVGGASRNANSSDS